MDECLPAEAVFRKERQTMIFRINDCLIDTDAYEVRRGDRVVSIAAGPRPAHHEATLAYAAVQDTIGPPASRLQKSGHRFSRYVQEPD
jgi:hypothetical protein